MSTYRLPRIADLAHQLRLSPARLRYQQVLAADHLLTLLEPDQYYPFSWVQWKITGYRPSASEVERADLRGSALQHDLLLMCREITRHNPIPQGALRWPAWSMPELAERLSVSVKTVSRWRAQGLPVWHVARADGEVRLQVPEQGLRRFVAARPEAVLRGRRFTQLSDEQRHEVTERAQQMRGSGCTSINRICRTIAEETGRSVETIRLTLLKHDPQTGRARPPQESPQGGQHEAIFRCHAAGDSVEDLARRYCRTERTIRKILASQQRRQLLGLKVDYIYNPEFDLPDAEERILAAGRDEGPAETDLVGERSEAAGLGDLDGLHPNAARIPLYMLEGGTADPLTPEQEVDTFRRYNYCKFRLAGLLQRLHKTGQPDLLEQAQAWQERVEDLRARLIEANLRLVISIARRHLRYGPSLEEMASEGNMILLRAIEKFDYGRGFKFSTYGSWALMKHYGRLVPLWQASRRRQVTGCEEALAAASVPEEASERVDRQLVGSLMHNLLGRLSKRERKVIQLHYGLPEGAAPHSLSQIAAKLGVSKERVRQIESKGLAKLRGLLDERQFHYLQA